MNRTINAAVAGETRAAVTMRDVHRELTQLENEAYARGWAAGVDSTAAADGGMFIIAYGAFGLCGGLIGAGITWLLMH